jgi:hypothetical protein
MSGSRVSRSLTCVTLNTCRATTHQGERSGNRDLDLARLPLAVFFLRVDQPPILEMSPSECDRISPPTGESEHEPRTDQWGVAASVPCQALGEIRPRSPPCAGSVRRPKRADGAGDNRGAGVLESQTGCCRPDGVVGACLLHPQCPVGLVQTYSVYPQCRPVVLETRVLFDPRGGPPKLKGILEVRGICRNFPFSRKAVAKTKIRYAGAPRRAAIPGNFSPPPALSLIELAFSDP